MIVKIYLNGEFIEVPLIIIQQLAVLILSLYYQKKSDVIFCVFDKSQAAAV